MRSKKVRVHMGEVLASEEEALLLRLVKEAEGAKAAILEGRFVLHDYQPAARATVTFAGCVARANVDGEYRLAVPLVEGHLYAARAGGGIACFAVTPFGRNAQGQIQRMPDLVLPRHSMSIQGRITGPGGQPLVDVGVSLAGGVRVPGIERVLENIAAGHRSGPVRTDDQGFFLLDGLADKEYSLNLRLGDRIQTTRALQAVHLILQ